MSTTRLAPEPAIESSTGSALTLCESDFYAELTSRNAGVIDPATQQILRHATVLIAGCGSIGGAAVEPLTRLGLRRFILADPGEYEINNLNRQNAVATDMGRNKSTVAARRVLAINPFAQVQAFPNGVRADDLNELLAGVDLVVDGVDVTTISGLRAKYLLNERAASCRLPLITGWDMAGAQYVRCYDYRKLRRAMDGRLRADDLDRLNMWQILQRLVPLRFVPVEMLTLARANLANPEFSFPQLVHAADMFGAITAHLVTQLLTGRPVRQHIYVDLHQLTRPPGGRWRTRIDRPREMIRALGALRSNTHPT
jgi:hypothetical protein